MYYRSTNCSYTQTTSGGATKVPVMKELLQSAALQCRDTVLIWMKKEEDRGAKSQEKAGRGRIRNGQAETNIAR